MKEEIDEAEQLAIQDAEPNAETALFADVYVPGSEPSSIRGRVLEETKFF